MPQSTAEAEEPKPEPKPEPKLQPKDEEVPPVNPGMIHEVADVLVNKIRSPILIFILVLNMATLGFIYFGVGDRRQKDFEVIQTLLKQCVGK